MSGESIQGIALQSVGLNAENLAFSEKLKKFGYVIDLGEISGGKRSKSALCVYDVFKEKQAPKILIVTSEKLRYNRYSELVTGLGADFKFASAVSGEGAFSDEMPALYIIGEKTLAAGESGFMAITQKLQTLWDLIIVDCGFSKTAVNPAEYLMNYSCKTEKLIIFAGSFQNDIKAMELLCKLPSRLLTREEPVAPVPDKKIIEYSLDSALMRYFKEDDYRSFTPDVQIIEYELDGELIKRHNEQVKLPAYKSGGNIFEELMLSQRKQYIMPVYLEDTLDEILTADKKLEAFLQRLDKEISGEGTVVVYFNSRNTLDYVEKVLKQKVYDFSVVRNDVYDFASVENTFLSVSEKNSAIILTEDGVPHELCADFISCVINYELPDCPSILMERYGRGGRNQQSAPSFIMFADKSGAFDGRIISNVLMFNFTEWLTEGLPSRNLISSVDGVSEKLTRVILELNEMQQETDDETRDFAFALKYNLETEGLGEVIRSKLEAFRKAFEISELTESSVRAAVDEKLSDINFGFAYLSENGAIEATKPNIDSNQYYSSLSDDNAYNSELEAAKELLTEKTDGDNYPFISDMMTEMGYNMRSAVLFNTWRFINGKNGLSKPYSEFIKLLNKGVI